MVVFFIDGFNLYHALKARQAYHKYKWLDLSKLSQCYVTRKERIEDIYYFSALATWSAQKVAKHQTYIRALKFRGVNVVYGKFKHRDKLCPLCNRYYTKPEEKQTDVNIAIYLFKLAIQDKYDNAIIVSGDSDLIPSITAVQETFPTKRIGIIIPIGR